ncbi:MAG: HD domain-containing protein [Anaeroplasmataceae bacterium]|nr:HD domain-containing protein [Anaeroplasmataceae bacterium]
MEIIGKVIGVNTSDNLLNITVVNEKDEQFCIKTSDKEKTFLTGCVYSFIVDPQQKERISYRLIEAHFIETIEKEDATLRNFYKGAPYDLATCKEKINSYISKIENPTIYAITEKLVEDYKDAYFVYPAATRMHHSYVGGLAYHTIGMLELSDSFLKNYPYLKKDYLYAGIILHDIGKIKELSGVQNTEYTLDGQLLGHLVMGALEIERAAIALEVADAKEVKMLEHMLISHHGQPQFGAAKRPITPEAIALWYIDTIDSKFRVLGEELERTPEDSFTETIGVLEKTKIYKD